MMLMNSKIRRFLIGEQLRGAPYLEKFELNPSLLATLCSHPVEK